MKIEPFAAEHGEAILAGQLNDDRNRPSPSFGKFIPDLVRPDLSFVGILNGHLIGAAGIYPIWEGVGEAWFLGTDRVDKNRMAVARTVRDGFETIARDHGFTRVQAAMRSDWPHLARWAKYLGMTHEGSMPRYGADGSDYERWARIWA